MLPEKTLFFVTKRNNSFCNCPNETETTPSVGKGRASSIFMGLSPSQSDNVFNFSASSAAERPTPGAINNLVQLSIVKY